MLKLVSKIWTVLTSHERRRLVMLTVMDAISSVADIAGLALLLWVIRLYAARAATGGAVAKDADSLWPIILLFFLFIAKNWLPMKP